MIPPARRPTKRRRSITSDTIAEWFHLQIEAARNSLVFFVKLYHASALSRTRLPSSAVESAAKLDRLAGMELLFKLRCGQT
jgi:hypothetical protein